METGDFGFGKIIIVVFSISLAIFIIGQPRMNKHYQKKREAVRTEQVQKQDREFKELRNNHYISIDQFSSLFKKAKKTKNKNLINQMGRVTVVDNQTGYTFTVKTNAYGYDLTPLKRDGKTVINKDWKKNHV